MGKKLCDELVHLNMDLLTMAQAFNGADATADDLFRRFVTVAPDQFEVVRIEFLAALDDMRKCTTSVLEHETPEAFDLNKLLGLHSLKTQTGLKGLDDLIEHVSAEYASVLASQEAPATMEDDEICRLCVIFCMLGNVVAHVSRAIEFSVEEL